MSRQSSSTEAWLTQRTQLENRGKYQWVYDQHRRRSVDVDAVRAAVAAASASSTCSGVEVVQAEEEEVREEERASPRGVVESDGEDLYESDDEGKEGDFGEEDFLPFESASPWTRTGAGGRRPTVNTTGLGGTSYGSRARVDDLGALGGASAWREDPHIRSSAEAASSVPLLGGEPRRAHWIDTAPTASDPLLNPDEESPPLPPPPSSPSREGPLIDDGYFEGAGSNAWYDVGANGAAHTNSPLGHGYSMLSSTDSNMEAAIAAAALVDEEEYRRREELQNVRLQLQDQFDVTDSPRASDASSTRAQLSRQNSAFSDFHDRDGSTPPAMVSPLTSPHGGAGAFGDEFAMDSLYADVVDQLRIGHAALRRRLDAGEFDEALAAEMAHTWNQVRPSDAQFEFGPAEPVAPDFPGLKFDSLFVGKVARDYAICLAKSGDDDLQYAQELLLFARLQFMARLPQDHYWVERVTALLSQLVMRISKKEEVDRVRRDELAKVRLRNRLLFVTEFGHVYEKTPPSTSRKLLPKLFELLEALVGAPQPGSKARVLLADHLRPLKKLKGVQSVLRVVGFVEDAPGAPQQSLTLPDSVNVSVSAAAAYDVLRALLVMCHAGEWKRKDINWFKTRCFELLRDEAKLKQAWRDLDAKKEADAAAEQAGDGAAPQGKAKRRKKKKRKKGKGGKAKVA